MKEKETTLRCTQQALMKFDSGEVEFEAVLEVFATETKEFNRRDQALLMQPHWLREIFKGSKND